MMYTIEEEKKQLTRMNRSNKIKVVRKKKTTRNLIQV